MITKGTLFGPRINLIGSRYERLTVVSLSSAMHLGHYMWECVCDCGNTAKVSGNNLRTKNTKSCGCLNGEKSSDRLRTHGMRSAPEYKVWASMLNRCRNPAEKCYSRYGGRGIVVCDRWLKFENFAKDMGDRPNGLTLERIDNGGKYCPENCRWATHQEQNSNKRSNVLLTFNGETKTQSQWARQLGVGHKLISSRIRFGWPIEKILTTPPRRKQS